MLTLKYNKITLNGNTPNCKTKHNRQKRDDNAARYKDGIKLNAEHVFTLFLYVTSDLWQNLGCTTRRLLLLESRIHGTIQNAISVWTLAVNWPQSHPKDLKSCI